LFSFQPRQRESASQPPSFDRIAPALGGEPTTLGQQFLDKGLVGLRTADGGCVARANCAELAVGDAQRGKRAASRAPPLHPRPAVPMGEARDYLNRGRLPSGRRNTGSGTQSAKPTAFGRVHAVRQVCVILVVDRKLAPDCLDFFPRLGVGPLDGGGVES